MRNLLAGGLTLALVTTGLTAAASAQDPSGTGGAARAGSNAGSSPITSGRAATAKPAKSGGASAAKHRLPANATGMGSQAANTTGATSNSH